MAKVVFLLISTQISCFWSFYVMDFDYFAEEERKQQQQQPPPPQQRQQRQQQQ